MTAQRIGIIGSSGGVGASTLVLGLARCAAAAGLRVVCVDAQWCSGGLDVVAGIEDQPGLRWADLTGVRGRMDGHELLAALPSAAGVAVLSVDRARPGPIPGEAVLPVVTAVAEATQVCLLDLPRWGMPLADDLATSLDDLLAVGASSACGLSGTAALFRSLDALPARTWLVHRGSGAEEDIGRAVAEFTGMPLLGVLPDDRLVPRALAAGTWPGSGHGSFAAACSRMVTQLRLQAMP